MPGISNINELQAMNLDLTADYWLANDIDATPTEGWNWDAGLGIFQGFAPVGIRLTNMTRRPTGDHSSGGAWAIFPADGIMWDKVNEDPPDEDARYIMATLNGDWALFNFAAFNIPANATNIGVWITSRSRRVAAGESRFNAYLRVGGINYQDGLGTNVPDLIYGNSNTRWSANPKTGLDWTVDDINGVGANALEAFGAILTDATPDVRITQSYIWVRYDLIFTGSLNGNGHKINGLYINRPADNVGLFGYVDLRANLISDLKFTNANIRGYGIGILAYAWETGSVSGVDAEGQLTIVGEGDCGGLVNYILTSGSFANCNVDVTISAGANVEIGGFVCLGGSMTFTDINVVVSISSLGSCPGTSENCLGGFIGDSWGPDVYTRCNVNGTIYAEGTTIGGGFIGCASSASTWNDCDVAVDITLSTVDSGDNSEIGGFIGYTANDEAFNRCNAAGDIVVTQLRPTQRATIGGFVGFTCTDESFNLCNATGDITVTHNQSGDTADVGGFIGFSCDDEHFDSCAATGDVTLNLIGVFVDNPAVGGFVGFLCWREIYEECYETGNVWLTVTGAVGAGLTAVAGFAGGYWTRDGIVRDSYSIGDVVVVADDAYVAGFIGNTSLGGAPVAADVSRCYSAGLVSATGVGNRVGGCIVADGGLPTELPPITAVFWDVEASGQATSDGGTGKTTAEMKVIDTFLAVGWDIDDANHGRNDGYPCSGWEVGSSRVWLVPGWTAGIGRKRSIPLGLVLGKGGFIHSQR